MEIKRYDMIVVGACRCQHTELRRQRSGAHRRVDSAQEDAKSAAQLQNPARPNHSADWHSRYLVHDFLHLQRHARASDDLGSHRCFHSRTRHLRILLDKVQDEDAGIENKFSIPSFHIAIILV